MDTAPTLQTLGQSLDNWQAIYIIAIVVAVVSTFAIVVFAFHIEKHKAGLRVSNYIYVFASILAVIATIKTVVKTRAVDKEKDRIASIQIVQAEADAATAKAIAKLAEADTGRILQENVLLENRMGGAEKTLTEVAAKTSERELKISLEDVDSIRAFGVTKSRIMCTMGDRDSLRVAALMYKLLVEADTKPLPVGQFLGGNDLADTPGVHIRVPPDGRYKGIGEALRKILIKNRIAADLKPATMQEEILVSELANDTLVIVVGPDTVDLVCASSDLLPIELAQQFPSKRPKAEKPRSHSGAFAFGINTLQG